jgi:hypothetical protein
MASPWIEDGKDSSNLNFEDCSGLLSEKETRPKHKANVKKYKNSLNLNFIGPSMQFFYYHNRYDDSMFLTTQGCCVMT